MYVLGIMFPLLEIQLVFFEWVLKTTALNSGFTWHSLPNSIKTDCKAVSQESETILPCLTFIHHGSECNSDSCAKYYFSLFWCRLDIIGQGWYVDTMLFIKWTTVVEKRPQIYRFFSIQAFFQG